MEGEKLKNQDSQQQQWRVEDHLTEFEYEVKRLGWFDSPRARFTASHYDVIDQTSIRFTDFSWIGMKMRTRHRLVKWKHLLRYFEEIFKAELHFKTRRYRERRQPSKHRNSKGGNSFDFSQSFTILLLVTLKL